MLAEAIFVYWRSRVRLLSDNPVSFSSYQSRCKLRDLGCEGHFMDIFGRYREYLLDPLNLHLVQLSLHLVKARLVGVIAFCLAGEFEVFGADQAGADQYRSATGCAGSSAGLEFVGREVRRTLNELPWVTRWRTI
jgi:hypothetical protein